MRRHARAVTSRPLSDFTATEQFCFFSSWMPAGQYGMPEPPTWGACRWATWDEYITDFEQVEAALRQRFAHVRREPFGALARAYQRQHGAAALARASYGQIRHHGEAS
ncbi:MAG: hypothetical protein IT177_11650 [Acidobacteria bacterium]|nr:hypothetical protein [Acidobacteriota bacterium]